jgi:acetolactate synthase I/II/III large subunit
MFGRLAFSHRWSTGSNHVHDRRRSFRRRIDRNTCAGDDCRLCEAQVVHGAKPPMALRSITSSPMKASDLFVRALENEGVEHIFGIPGEENLDLLESLRTSRIELVLTRHEQAAGFMAATHGRLTGKPGVCLSTLGPGATNLVTPAAFAQLGGMPMLMITGQKPIKTSKQGRFQIVDVVGMMRPLTKYTHQIVDGGTIPAKVREAFRRAVEERPGAVHLELPEDVAAEDVESPLFHVPQVRRQSPDNDAVEIAADMLRSAKSPLLLIGAGANRHRTSDVLRDFVDRCGIYAVSTQMGLGVVDENHPHFLGAAALSDNDYVHRAIRKADLILNVGHDVVEKPPFFMEEEGASVIHVNYNSAEVDPVYFPQLEVVGDIATTVRAIGDALGDLPGWDNAYFQTVKADLDRQLGLGADSLDFPIKPRRLVADVRAALPDSGILTLDNGIYKIWFARHFRAANPSSLLLDNALATMGAGLSSAIAAKIVRPWCKVMTVCGDGGFMMNSQEIETALRLGLDLVIVVLTDSSYGMIRWKQAALGFEDFGLSFTNPDFVAYANSYGARGVRVESAEELRGVLQDRLNTPGVHLVEVPTDYSENEMALVDDALE